MKIHNGLLLASTALALVPASNAWAQDTATSAPQEEVDESTDDFGEPIIVTGIRGSLQASQDIKRNASVIVDAVSSEDVGKFPDTNVAESLQRITGVSIDRAGGEGQFITVRGLGPEFNAVLLNGRTLATDNDGREFSFDVLSSDIIQTAEVYKSSQPGLQSGGIGAVVNVTTAKPLDRPGFNVTLSAAGIYEDLSEDFGTDLTGVVSWSNDTFGVLFGASYNKRNALIDRAFTNGFSLRDGAVNPGDVAINAPENSVGLDATSIVPIPTSRVQQQVVFERDTQDRERLTLNGALQFAPSSDLKITVDALYSDFQVDSFATQFSGFFSPPFINPQIDENGTVTSFSRPSLDFQARNPLIAGQAGASQNDNVITSNSRFAETFAIGGNVDFRVSDSLSFVFDASYSEANRDGTNPFIVLGALAPTSPLIESTSTSGISTITNLSGLTDTSIQRLHFVNVNRTVVDDEVFELRLDGDWEIQKGPLERITFGGLYTDRTKSRTLFDNFAAPGNGVSAAQIFCAFCGYTVPFDESILTPFSFNGFLSGVDGADTVPSTTLTSTFAQAFAVLNDPANLNNPDRTGGNTAGLLAILADPNTDPLLGIFTPTFNPGGSFSVDEQIYSAYFNSQWEGDFGGELPWSANIGFRIAFTDVVSSGVTQPVIEFRETAGDTQLEVIFGAATPTSVPNDYVNFLPSASFRLEPTSDTVLRLSYARTVTRPTLTALGVSNVFGGRSNAPTSGGGNPLLEAFEADNFDVSFEWYFDSLSYFSIAGFYKSLGNFIETSTLPVVNPIIFPAGNAGRTADETVDVTFQDTRDRNGQSGSISGVEIAFQKTFDIGFGAIVNYTYVNSNRDDVPADDLGFNGFTPHTFNITGFYEKDGISARVAYNYRDGFLVQAQDAFSEPRQRESFGQLDFAASYDFNDNIQIFAEGINVLGEDTRDFSRFANRLLDFTRTGARYTVGVRGKF
ncbi:TonB-dependent receptor [Parasphingorhabdus sp. DH2-15]|uniref:TonB-dependent receptor n=1 Tax=Parasphingorhabdus sp. DH2-15 TaxID=3444112 RepID=UPI003F685576